MSQAPAPSGGTPQEMPLHDQFTLANQMQQVQGASREQLLNLYRQLLTYHLAYKHTTTQLLLEKLNGHP